MYLVAQRVVTPRGEGINAYRHEHGEVQDWVWSPPDRIPDREPGEVVREIVTLQGFGRVASYLDFAAPDATPPEQLQWSHDALVALLRTGASVPLQIISGPLLIRFELESRLYDQWHQELDALLDAMKAL